MKAYTLTEVLLSISLFSMILGLSVPVYNDYQKRAELEAASELTATSIFSAQENARAANQDSAWGIHFSGNTATIFKGTSFAARDSTEDIPYSLSSGNNYTGLSEVIFGKNSGNTTNTGTLIISNDTKAINLNINEKGSVLY